MMIDTMTEVEWLRPGVYPTYEMLDRQELRKIRCLEDFRLDARGRGNFCLISKCRVFCIYSSSTKSICYILKVSLHLSETFYNQQ